MLLIFFNVQRRDEKQIFNPHIEYEDSFDVKLMEHIEYGNCCSSMRRKYDLSCFSPVASGLFSTECRSTS